MIDSKCGRVLSYWSGRLTVWRYQLSLRKTKENSEMGSRRRGQLAHGADSAFVTTLRATIGLSRGSVHDAINSTLRILLCDGMRRTSDHMFAALRHCRGGPPGP